MTKDRSGCMPQTPYTFGASRRSHENFKSSHEVVTVDFQVVLMPSQVVNANPSDSQVCVLSRISLSLLPHAQRP